MVAAAGERQVICVALQLETAAFTPLNETVEVPCEAPKLLPVIVTVVPASPMFGVTEAMTGVETGAFTVKLTPFELFPETFTTTFPVNAPPGTEQERDVEDQVVQVAVVPLNLTVLNPWDAPNVVPEIVTDAPTTPLVGLSDEMLGVTVKAIAFEALPP